MGKFTVSALRMVLPIGTALLGLACSPPPGDSGGRVEMGKTTASERKSLQVSNETLDESADRAVDQLMGDLLSIPELTSQPRSKGYQATIVIGDIDARGEGVTRGDGEIVVRLLRRKLNQSRTLRETVRIIENRAAVDALRNRERPVAPPAASGDLLGQSAGGGQVREFWDPTAVFYLNGEIYGRRRGDTIVYDVGWGLVRDSDQTIIWQGESTREKRGK